MNAKKDNNAYNADTENNVLTLTTGANIVAEVNNFIGAVEKTTNAISNNQSTLQPTDLSTSIDGFIAELYQNIEV